MPHDIAMTADDKRWEAESDARTLSEAKIINDDEKRLSAATTAADRLAEEKREQAEAMEKVAKTDNDKKTKIRSKMFPNTNFDA